MKFKVIKKNIVFMLCALLPFTGLIVTSCSQEKKQNKYKQELEYNSKEYFCLSQEILNLLDSYLKGIDKLVVSKTKMSNSKIKVNLFSAHYFLKTHFEEHLASLNKLNTACNNKNSEIINKLTNVLKKLINICYNINLCLEENNLNRLQRYVAERNEEFNRLVDELGKYTNRTQFAGLSDQQVDLLYKQAKTLFKSDNNKLLGLYEKHNKDIIEVLAKERLTMAQCYLIWLSKEYI